MFLLLSWLFVPLFFYYSFTTHLKSPNFLPSSSIFSTQSPTSPIFKTDYKIIFFICNLFLIVFHCNCCCFGLSVLISFFRLCLFLFLFLLLFHCCCCFIAFVVKCFLLFRSKKKLCHDFPFSWCTFLLFYFIHYLLTKH